jgi:hypothetical protein
MKYIKTISIIMIPIIMMTALLACSTAPVQESSTTIEKLTEHQSVTTLPFDLSSFSETTEKANTDASTVTSKRNEFQELIIEWPLYDDAEKLVAEADYVMIAKIVDIYYDVLDITTANPATSDTKKENKMLYTFYKLETIKSFKGKSFPILDLKIEGGRKDIMIQQQQEVIEKYNMDRIAYLPQIPSLDKNSTYLFVVLGTEGRPAYAFSPHQSIYRIDIPETEYNGISAKKIISSFGEDKWKEFVTSEY